MTVEQQVSAWQSRLIELNKRNPLYCLPSNNNGQLLLAGQAADDLFKLLISPRRHLLFTKNEEEMPQPGKRSSRPTNYVALADEDFKKINNLRLRASSALAEQGINILYVAFGILEWTTPDTRETVRSPLVLLPVALERLPGGEAFRLTRLDDEIELNPTLTYRLAQPDISLQLPPLPDEDEFVPTAYFDAVAAQVARFASWTVSPAAVLGRFSFLKMAMYRDLERQRARACAHPLIESFAGNPQALERLPAIELPALSDLDRALKGETGYCVLDADPSQQRAVLAAKRGQSFVLQGPPGTGKTQTIANIIAEKIADGKRVLFVSQKMAALDAVFKRLRDHGLHDLCLEAHSHKASKKIIVEQLKAAYDAQRRSLESPETDLAILDRLKEQLAAVAEELHAKRLPLGISIYEANGRIAEAAGVPDLPFSLVNPHELDSTELHDREELAQRLARHHNLFAEAWTHPWRGIRADRFTLDLQTRVRSLFNDLLAQFALCDQGIGSLTPLCGITPPETLRGVREALELADLLTQTPHPPASWFTDGDATELRATATRCREQYAEHLAAHAILTAEWSETLLGLPHAELLERLTARHEPELRPALGEAWQDLAASRFPELRPAIEKTIAAANQLAGSLATLAARCGLASVPTISHCRYLLRISGIVREDIRPQPSWFAHTTLAALGRTAEEASRYCDDYRTNRAELLAVYTENLFRLDITALDARFANDYTSVLKYVRPGYYRDCRSLRECLRAGGSLHGRNLAGDIAAAHKVVEARQWTEGHDAELQADFGTHYRALDTDWADVRRHLKAQETLLSLLPGGSAPEALKARMIEGGPEIAAVGDIHQQVSQYLERLEACVAELGAQMELTSLPFTDLPLSQAPLPDLTAWLSQLKTALTDYEDAHRQVRACRIEPGDVSTESLLKALGKAARLTQQRAAIEAESAALRQSYAAFYHGVSTDWEAVLAGLDWVERLSRSHAGAPLPPELIRVATEGSVPHLANVAAARNVLAERLATLEMQLDALRELFPPERLYAGDKPLAEAFRSEIVGWLQIRLNRLSELEEWIDFQNLGQECDAAGLMSFYETTIHTAPAAGQIVPAFRKRFHQLWFDYICDSVPTLRQFRGEHHAELIADFQRRDIAQIETAPQRIRALAQKRRPLAAVDFGQMGALRRLLASKRLKPIRKMLADIPDVLFQYKPCLLMSPLSVSLFLEAEAFEFDAVIFDEASQIFIEDALCSLLRAKQVIIAGDTQQLPPTSFFKNLEDGDDEDEEAEQTRYESVLHAAGLLARSDTDHAADEAGGYPQRFAEHELTWHYRSRHDTLIAFSKVHFYDRIIPFPAPTSKSAVTIVHVPDGVYYPGQGKRNNPVEAAAVVDQVISYAREHPDHSVGVITFNEAQKNTIDALVEQRCLQEPDLARILSEEGTEGFFVKNIENVQGDERDAIFLSVGFARTPDGKISMNFGPLNQDGGERRLNVAITRARHRMTIVSSLLASDIDLARTDRLGPKLLKAYLEYAQSGGVALKGEEHTQSPFEAAVELAINGAGYDTRRHVGRFGYTVSLGVVHPDRPDEFILGIECDNKTYRDAETVRSRDRLRGQVLQGLHWHLHRVWSCDWVRNPARELARIEAAIQAILHPAKSVLAPPQATLRYSTAQEKPNRVREDDPAYALPNSEAPSAAEPVSMPETLLVNDLLPGTSYYAQTAFTFPGGRDSFYDETKAGRKQRSDLMLEIVEQDGPMPVEAAIQRMADAADIGRVGPRVRDLIETAIDDLIATDRIEERGGFLYRLGVSSFPARIARNGDPTRPIEQICIEEIGEVAIALLKVSFGMRHDELVLEVARLFGYRSTSVNIRDRISEAISYLELYDRIHVTGGQIRALELA